MHPALAAVVAAAALLPAARADDPPVHSFGAPLAPGATEPTPQPPTPSPRPAEAPAPAAGGAGQRLPAVPPAPGAVWPHDPALARLEAERAALGMVDHAARQAGADASRRIGAMHAFIDRRGLQSRWAAFARDHVATLDQLTFDDAVARAKAQAAGAPPAAASNDVDHLEQAVEVEAGVARAAWNQLNRQRRAVDALSSFLLQEDLLDDYLGWAPGFMRSMGWKPPSPPADGTPDPLALRTRGVQLEWDRAQREQRAQQQQQQQQQIAAPGGLPAGASLNPPSQNGQVPAPVALGPSPARSPFANSWWNGYADPYYDACGFPGRDPNLSTAMADDPKTYGFAPEAYTDHAWPWYAELGVGVYPGFGMFTGGVVGGAVTGAAGGGGFGGAVGR